MREWPDIQFTSTHQELFNELNKRCGGPHWYSTSTRAKHPKGFHRLIDLVPRMFPDQKKLARTLAECAIANRRSEAWDKVPFIVRERFELALQQDDGAQRLAKEARHDWVAWEACRLYRERTTELVKTQNGTWDKRVRPIPEPVRQLMEDHFFLDDLPRPGPSKPGRRSADSVSYHGAIVLCVWMACESALLPTSRGSAPSGCQIVSDLLGLPVNTVKDIWSKRDSKPKRAPRNYH